MTTKQCLMALMLAGFSTMSLAQNCQGLVGGAMAQCMQGIGSGSGRAASETPRQESRAPASSESTRAGVDTRSDMANSGSSKRGWSFSDWNFFGFGSKSASVSPSPSPSVGNGASTGGNCQGLVGGAMALCLQGAGQAFGRSVNASSRQEGSTPVGSETASSGEDGPGIVTNFRIGGNSLNCGGLVGGAMAQCLRGN